MSTLETASNYICTVGLEKAVLPVPPTKIKVLITFTEATDSEYSEEWLKAIEPDLKSTRATTCSVVVIRRVLNIPQKVASTKWALKEKYDRSSKARRAVLGWKQKHGSIDCVITFVCRFD